MVKSVIWSKSAQNQLHDLFDYILKDSYQNAEKVKTEILDATKILSDHFEKYPIDKYKIKNDGSFRAFEIYNYRITYKISPTIISILKIRHTKMKPKYS